MGNREEFSLALAERVTDTRSANEQLLYFTSSSVTADEDGPAYLGRVKPDGAGGTEIPLPDGWDRYGHFTVGTPGQLVSDGYFKADQQDDSPICPWLSILTVDWDLATARWQPLCRHDSSWNSQDSHPHPILNHSCSHVYFTSDADGRRAVYRCGMI